jgi:acetyltransferase
VLHPPEIAPENLPRLAIRPYPTRYVGAHSLKDGTAITIRPIRPEDEPLMVRFHESLSEQSVYLRYFHLIKLSQRTAHERLIRICFNDYDREIALVAERNVPEQEILAIARLSKPGFGSDEAEFSMLVRDNYQGQGLGTELLRRLIQVGRDEKLRRITADILPDNYGMQRICERLGFQLERREDVIHAQIVME